MKKLIALILAFTLVLSMTACGKGNDGASNDKPADSASSNTETKADAQPSNGEAYEVTLMFPTLQSIPSEDAIQRVEDFINAYIKDSLGITEFKLDLKFASLFTYADDINLQLAAGDKMDIIYTGNLATAVTNGYLTDLTPYIDNELAGAKEVIKDWLSCGTTNGIVYAIPCYKGQVLSWKYIYDKQYVDGIGYDMSKVKSYKDLEPLFEALKAAYPNEVFEVFCNQYPSLTSFAAHDSVVGTYFATQGDSTQLVNYFKTDSFKEACEIAYRHRQLGYADPEGSANTLSHDAVVMSGSSKGVIMGHAYSIETIEQMFTMNNSYGGQFGAVEIAKSDMTTNTLTYGIPYTSKNPSAAAKMMNLIWTDETIASALIYGIEGEDYVWNDDHTSIKYPDGLGIDTVPYSALYTCGAFGNQFLLYGFDGNTSNDDKDFMLKLIKEAWYPPLFGFIPSSANVSTQVAAVSNVYNQYYDSLTYGDVNPDEFLPQFLDALDAAGINEIMADYQAQVDAWVAQNK
ncbi:MAG: ABC transporter substrate-binding protein [Lachnospiraceae bacterium]|nr:ABC transporter substrate-binding protein [Lachnospiraceae bacterium]